MASWAEEKIKMADQKEIPIERARLKEPKKKDIVKSKHAMPGESERVLNFVEEVMTRLRKDIEAHIQKNPDGFKKDQDMFKIISGLRDMEQQRDIWNREKKRLQGIIEALEKKKKEKGKLSKGDSDTLAKAIWKEKDENLRQFIAKPADEGEKKVVPHMTGAVVDINLGYPPVTKSIDACSKSKEYEIFSKFAYHTYKMAPLFSEPWHWECGDACKANIEAVIKKEKDAAKKISDDENEEDYYKPNPLPQGDIPKGIVPVGPESDCDTHAEEPKKQLDEYGLPILTEAEIAEIEREYTVKTPGDVVKKVLTVVTASAILCGLHYFVLKKGKK